MASPSIAKVSFKALILGALLAKVSWPWEFKIGILLAPASSAGLCFWSR